MDDNDKWRANPTMDEEPPPYEEYMRYPSVDLVQNAHNHLTFLREIDLISEQFEKPHIIANAVRRYENFWLPLLRKNDPKSLLPPVDVKWAWYLHMLCPRQYADDVTKIAGELVDHEFKLLRGVRSEAKEASEKIWESLYPDEPFLVAAADIPESFTYKQKEIGYDIQGVSSRQLQFYYNVSLPHFSLVPYLEAALQRYLKFIQLKKSSKYAFLVPMYDIDLMWLTHQLTPVAYRNDYKSFLGYVLNHDDTATDRSPGSHLNQSYSYTRNLWRQTFNEEYAIPGVGYRGPMPRGKLHRIEKEVIDSYKPQKATVRMDSVTLKTSKKTGKISGDIMLENWPCDHVPREHREVHLPEVKEEPFHWVTNPGRHSKCMFEFVMKPESSVHLKAKLKSGKGPINMIIPGTVFEEYFSATREIKKMVSTNGKETTVSDQGKDGNVLEMKFSVIDTEPYTDMIEFHLEEGKFSETSMPENNESLWGPICLPKLPPGIDNKCQVADHRLVNKAGMLVVVRVIHSLTLNISAVQVFHENKMAAVSHLIGQEQLPTPEKGADSGVTLDVKRGERAMLIKNRDGDWGIVKGKWEKATTHTIKHGNLSVKVRNLKRNQNSTFEILDAWYHKRRSREQIVDMFKYLENRVSMLLNDFTIDCKEGNLAENIAVLFSSLVLYVLCEPRRGDKPGADREANAKQRKGPLNPVGYATIRSAGYMVDTPSNNYYWWKRQSNKGHYRNYRMMYDEYYYYNHDYDDDDRRNNNDDNQDGGRHFADDCGADYANEVGTNDIFCPWDPDYEMDQGNLIHGFDFVYKPSTATACGSCGTSMNTIGGYPIDVVRSNSGY